MVSGRTIKSGLVARGGSAHQVHQVLVSLLHHLLVGPADRGIGKRSIRRCDCSCDFSFCKVKLWPQAAPLMANLIRPMLFEPTDCKVHDVSLRHELAIGQTNPTTTNDMAGRGAEKVLADAIKV